MTVGRSAGCGAVLSHPTVSPEHARLALEQGQVWLEDLGSAHGTFVNGARVMRFPLRPGDVVRFGSAAAYRFDGEALLAQSAEGGMALELAGVAVQRDGRPLLGPVDLKIPGGNFVGLLGPSGVGKSLLLHVLSSTLRPTAGAVRFDGSFDLSDHLDDYRSALGVVTQDDLVFEYLTAEENLYFAARLRMPGLGREEVRERVEAALEAVDLTAHRRKRVEVLSGGQRKRVGVAIELLLRPRLLLLDEPTSGLDPAVQAKIADMLRGLSRQGITVVCTTHTMDTLHFFDEVVVLGRTRGVGAVAFVGPPGDLQRAFRVANHADLFERLMDLEPGPVARGRSSGSAEPFGDGPSGAEPADLPAEPSAGAARRGTSSPAGPGPSRVPCRDNPCSWPTGRCWAFGATVPTRPWASPSRSSSRCWWSIPSRPSPVPPSSTSSWSSRPSGSG